RCCSDGCISRRCWFRSSPAIRVSPWKCRFPILTAIWVAQHIDVAIRIGRLEDSSMVARRLGMFRRVVCAAPSYLEQQGIPKHPNDLADHQCLIFTMLTDPVDW